jgi:hypothetical protein
LFNKASLQILHCETKKDDPTYKVCKFKDRAFSNCINAKKSKNPSNGNEDKAHNAGLGGLICSSSLNSRSAAPTDEEA